MLFLWPWAAAWRAAACRPLPLPRSASSVPRPLPSCRVCLWAWPTVLPASAQRRPASLPSSPTTPQGLAEAGLAPKHRAMPAPHVDDSARALGSTHSSGGGSAGPGLDGTEGELSTHTLLGFNADGLPQEHAGQQRRRHPGATMSHARAPLPPLPPGHAAVHPAASVGDLQAERRWGAPYGTQVALLFQRSLKTRRFEVGAWCRH